MESGKKNEKIVVKMEKMEEESYEGEDEDCYVIETSSDDYTRKFALGETSSSDVVLVAEKGPIALRDFPHPRHLCANFPFNSTAHENYCDQCFCGVCEVRAPCLQWGVDAHFSVFKKATTRIFFIY